MAKYCKHCASWSCLKANGKDNVHRHSVDFETYAKPFMQAVDPDVVSAMAAHRKLLGELKPSEVYR